jgi:gamma-glutamylcyclotransferase (GGCT)/AIG2-like uncharacterized protein YtfP
MQLVAGTLPVSGPAVLRDHARRAVRGAVYPGVLPKPGASVEGLLWSGIVASAMCRLDAFEGALYERRSLRVETPEGAADAEVYVVRRARRSLLADEDWDLARFEARELAAYLEGCRRFAARFG